MVDKLVEAARSGRNHGYSSSRGLPNLRKAVAERYRRRFGVEVDPDTEVISTIGAKEGLSHLMWTLVQPGDVALVPEPSYPIHIYAAALAGAEARRVPIGGATDFFDALEEAFHDSWPRPRVILTSFPHNPTTRCVELEFFTRLVAFAGEHDVMVVHDFAYADIAFDGYRPPSLLQVPGAKEVGVELYTLSKSHSMAGWRVGFVVGNPAMVDALAQLKSYLDYGTFQPIQIASIIALNEGDDFVAEVNAVYREPPQHAGRRARPVRVGGGATPRVDVRLGRDSRVLREGIARLHHPSARPGQGGGQPGHRFRGVGRPPRPVRPGGERASHHPGGARDPSLPGRAAVTYAVLFPGQGSQSVGMGERRVRRPSRPPRRPGG